MVLLVLLAVVFELFAHRKDSISLVTFATKDTKVASRFREEKVWGGGGEEDTVDFARMNSVVRENTSACEVMSSYIP